MQRCLSLGDRVGHCQGSLGVAYPHVNFPFPGIYYDSECSSKELDHGILVVGYGFEGTHPNVTKYWLVKNRYVTTPHICILKKLRSLHVGVSL